MNSFEGMYHYHRDEAILNFQKYQDKQAQIDRMERRATEEHGFRDRVVLGDPMNFPYVDACTHRRIYMDLAMLHSQMAIMLKP